MERCASRARSRWRLGGLVGAVALPALMVWLPSAAGVAVADTRGGGASVASSGESADGGAAAVSPSQRGPARIGRIAARAVGDAVADSAVPALAPAASRRAVAGGPVSRAAAAVPAGASARSSAADVSGFRLADVEAASPLPVAGTRGRGVGRAAPRVAAAVPLEVPASSSAMTEAGTPAVAVAVAESHALLSIPAERLAVPVPGFIANVRAAILTAVDSVGNWLSGRPSTPITEFLTGALLLVRRALDPGVGASVGNGATKLTIRNELPVVEGSPPPIIDIYAYQLGTKKLQKTLIAKLSPGQEWSNTASNFGPGGNDRMDHNLEIAVHGESPVMRLAANNRPFRPAYVRVVFAPPGGGPNQCAVAGTRTCFPSEVNNTYVGEATTIDRTFEGGPKLWIYRGNDIDSGAWYTENTKDIVVALWKLPATPYDKGNDVPAIMP